MKPTATANEYAYYALKYAQRGAGKGKGPAFLLFHAAAAELKAWADVDRLEPTNRQGAQRPLREIKVKKIARFLAQDPRNTIPTSIVVAIDESAISFKSNATKSGGAHGTLTIKVSGRKKPGLIIDGQHRAYGIAEYSGATQVNIVAIVGGDDAERAFQFVVINNAATRINRDHIKALNLNYDKSTLNNRLVSSAGLTLGLKEDKFDDLHAVNRLLPFKGMLKFPTNKKGFIPPSAIELALGETHQRAASAGFEQLELDVFLAIWSTIRALRPGVWIAGSHLLEKVPLYALTVFILDSMVAAQRAAEEPADYTEEAELEKLVRRVVGRIPEIFWTMEWSRKEGKELDTGGGRAKMLSALSTIESNVRLKRDWYENVSIVDPALLPKKKKRQTSKPPRKRASPA